VTVELPPAPLSPYGISKLMCEQIGRAFHEETGADFLAWRIGYFQRGENLAGPHMAIGAWGQSMWLSNRDMLQAAEKSIAAPAFGYAVVNLMSNNLGMRWDIDHTREVIGYVPLDHATPQMEARNREQDETAASLRVAPGTWLDENFAKVSP
jgi:uronate dehydrogenase